MRRISFRLRLITAAAVWVTAGLGASWFAIDAIFRAHIMAEFHEELSHHGSELALLVQSAGTEGLRLRQPLSDRRFYQPGSGYYWQVEMNGTTLGSPSLSGARISSEAPGHGDGLRRVPGPTGEMMLHEELLPLPDAARPAIVRIGIDVRLINDLLHSFDLRLGLSMGIIGLGLVAAVVAQVTYGLWPLKRVRQSLAAIRAGQAERMPDDLPPEVAPLTASLNEMMAANDEVVRRARTQAGNLAHALRTPLAILMDEAERLEGAGLDGSALRRECQRMQRQIDYQLSKARAAVSRGRPYAALPVAPAVARLVGALSRLPDAAGLDFHVDQQTPGLAVRCESEDFDEMLGNLVENATKWAAGEIRIGIAGSGPDMVLIQVDDDGPGLPAEDRERVFGLGERLDERVPGTGLGLTIVRDLAELYGGKVWIGASRLNGASANLLLPRATDSAAMAE